MTNRGSLLSYPFAGFLVLSGLFCGVHTPPAWSAPAARQIVPVLQPDGTAFVARPYGDEWSNGMETVDGYAIVLDGNTGYWTFADRARNGSLVPSPYVVGRDLPSGLPRGLRADRLDFTFGSFPRGSAPDRCARPRVTAYPGLARPVSGPEWANLCSVVVFAVFWQYEQREGPL